MAGKHADALQFSVSSPGMVAEETFSSSRKDDQGAESIAQVHLITPVTLGHGIPIHLSILSSFLARLPPSVQTLRISFILPLAVWRSKSSFFSLECLENAIEPDGALNLCIRLEQESIKATFGDYAFMDSNDSDVKPFTCTFNLPYNRSQADIIFDPVALYSKAERRFVPINEWESSPIQSTYLGTFIQLSVSPTRIPGVRICAIALLPPELLSLVFEFLSLSEDESAIEGISNKHLVSFTLLSAVCQLWKVVSVPYLFGIVSVKEKHARLKGYSGAGRLWEGLQFETWVDKDISVDMAREVIAGSPNVTHVYMDAFWNEEEAKIVLDAIEGLAMLEEVIFGSEHSVSRKWKKEEIENFMWRMSARIRFFRAYDVEDSACSTSPGLQLSSDLKYLGLHGYPPLPSLSLAHALTGLRLSNLCPLPPSVSGSCLPSLLEDLTMTLAPYSPDGKFSILPSPLDFSHLKHLTFLRLDGGEDASNLVPAQLFHNLRNAKVIEDIDVRYCVVNWEYAGFVFSDIICWFFGDRGLKEELDTEDRTEKVGNGERTRVAG
ncbi:hypothetical protein BT69DRAFT_1322327 [Atractiella rhizophila]|nr:hypothetical protein BT69DRAFT_1322327 [Atractiella rhizophila]